MPQEVCTHWEPKRGGREGGYRSNLSGDFSAEKRVENQQSPEVCDNGMGGKVLKSLEKGRAQEEVTRRTDSLNRRGVKKLGLTPLPKAPKAGIDLSLKSVGICTKNGRGRGERMKGSP